MINIDRTNATDQATAIATESSPAATLAGASHCQPVRRTQSRWMLGALVGAMAGLWAVAAPAAETRTLDLYNTHTKERLTITFKKNGKYVASSLKELSRFLRDWRRNEPTNMDPRLFDTVWEVYSRSGSRQPIHVVSAYRSPSTNEMLRSRSRAVAKHSQHTLGKAMDLFLPDVKTAKLREIGVGLQRGGVGFYPNANTPFVHIDVGSVRAWPRMSRSQLMAIFPDGKSVHLPTDGKPLPRYQEAMAELKRNGSVASRVQVAEEGGKKKRVGLLAMLFSDEEDETEELNASMPTVERPAGTAGSGPVLRSVPKAPAPAKAEPAPTVVAEEPKPAATVVAEAAPPAKAPEPAPAAVAAGDPPPAPPAKPEDLQAPEPVVEFAAVDPTVLPRRRPELAVAEDAPVQMASVEEAPAAETPADEAVAAPVVLALIEDTPPGRALGADARLAEGSDPVDASGALATLAAVDENPVLVAAADEPADARSALAEVARDPYTGAAPTALGYASAIEAPTAGRGVRVQAASLTPGAPNGAPASLKPLPAPKAAVAGKTDPLAAFERAPSIAGLPVFDGGHSPYGAAYAQLRHPNQRASELAFSTPTQVVVASFDRRPYGTMTAQAFTGVAMKRLPVVVFAPPRQFASR